MAIGGTISVDIANYSPQAAQINVTARSGWTFAPVSPTKRSNPYTDPTGVCSIGVPAVPSAGNMVGYFCLDQRVFHTPYLIQGGPNHGFRYVYSASNSDSGVPTTFNYVTAGYLDDAGSDFSRAQCGNYDPATGTGYISQSQLLSNSQEHERGGTTGHYANYLASNSASNLKTAMEGEIGLPNQTQEQFNAQVSAVAATAGTAIKTATEIEACNQDARRDPYCVFRGYINWPTYVTCPFR